jgi:hypothetical protein
MLGAYLRPVGIQLLGGQGGEPGERALAEFNMLDQHGDEIVSSDANERIRREVGGPAVCAGGRRRAGLAVRRTRQMEPDDEPGDTFEGGAARQPCVVMSHGFNFPGASRRRESQRGYGRRSRNGTGCRSWRDRCRGRSAA